jgi:hypothetical protein
LSGDDRIAVETHGLLVERARERGWPGTRATRVGLDEVRRAFTDAGGGRTGEEQPEPALAACMEILREHGVLTPMHATNREKTPLARGFRLAAVAEAVPRDVPDMPIWHRELYDLAGHWRSVNPLRRARYVAVNRWLKSGADRTEVPLRERCLDVFAVFGAPECHQEAEKTLDRPTTAALFGEEDRLLSVLRTFRTPPPLLTEFVTEIVTEDDGGGWGRVGTGDLLLVLENSTTWWSIVNALPAAGEHRVGYVAWGLGGGFIRSVESIAERHRISEIRYFGDLDFSGVRIPFQAAVAARNRGLPPVVPATRLYDALFALGRPAPARDSVPADKARPFLEWLAPLHRGPAANLLATGSRLAQEWVGTRHLKGTTEWFGDLR